MRPQIRRTVWVLAVAGSMIAGCTGTDGGSAATTGSTSTGSSTGSSTGRPATPGSSTTVVASGSGESSGSAVTGSPTGSAAESAAGVVKESLTPVIGTVTTLPVPVRTTDGKVTLAYELSLVNVPSVPVTITTVKVIDVASGSVWQEYSGDALLAHFKATGNAPGGAAPTAAVLTGGQHGFVWLDPAVPDGSAVPTQLRHELTLSYGTAPNPLIPAQSTETIAPTAVRKESAPVITSPLRGPNWFDANGCCDEVTPHRGSANPVNGEFYFAERFAIDWVQLDEEKRLYTGDQTKVESYPYYGAEVHAVADGVVVATLDGEPTQTPGASPAVGALTIDQYGGNYVVEQFDQDGETYYAFFAHLQPGSVDGHVKVGQQVRAGDAVGLLGNTGNTDAPHLHFHVMNSPNPLASDGLPYEFEEFSLVGQAASDDAIGTLFSGAPLPLSSPGVTGPRTKEMPSYLDLLDFPASGS